MHAHMHARVPVLSQYTITIQTTQCILYKYALMLRDSITSALKNWSPLLQYDLSFGIVHKWNAVTYKAHCAISILVSISISIYIYNYIVHLAPFHSL